MVVYKISLGKGKGYFYSNRRIKRGSYIKYAYGNYKLSKKRKGSFGRIIGVKKIGRPTAFQRFLSRRRIG